MNPSRVRQPVWLECRVRWQTFNSSASPLASRPEAASTPPLSSSTDPTVATADAAVVVTMVVVLAAARTVAVSHNNKPLFLAVATLVHSNQLVSPLPTPAYKRWENWNSRHTHGSDVDNNHTSTTCGKPGPRHNPNASRAITMGGSITIMQKTILPTAAGCVPPTMRPQQQQMP